MASDTDTAYKTLVLPILENCSAVWDPHVQTLNDQIERIQNRAARFVTGDYSRFSSVTAMKKKLKWNDLETRRKVARLIIFHQALQGHLAIPVRQFLQPVQRETRSSKIGTNFIQLSANKNCYQDSFVPQTLKDWNSLPHKVITIQEKEKFIAAIHKELKIFN